MALTGINLRGHASPLLYQLMQHSGLTVHLAVMRAGEAVLIDRIEPPGGRKLATWVGKRMSLHCTALGKALIAHLRDTELDELIGKQGLIRYNENTIVTRRKLRMACEQVQQLGYAIDDEEEELGVRCVGAPVRDAHGDIAAAISICGAKPQLEDLAFRAAQVRETAEALSHHLNPIVFDEQRPFAC
jgi:DNA-binding IclR family transcriptional regulator